MTNLVRQSAERVQTCYKCEHRRQDLCAIDGVAILDKATDSEGQCREQRWPAGPELKPTTTGGFGVKLPELRIVSDEPPPSLPARLARAPRPVRSPYPRVGIIYPMWMNGGVERHTETLIQNASGVKWTGLAAVGPDFVDRDKLAQMSRYLPVGGEELIERISEESDFVIVWGFSKPQKWLEKLDGRVIAMAHGTGEWTAAQLTQTLPYAAGAVAVSRQAVSSFPTSWRATCRVILNGIDLNRLAPMADGREIRGSLEIPIRSTVIGHVGRLSEEKNPLAAAKVALNMGRDAVALYVGDGPCGKEIISRAESIAPGQVRWLREAPFIGTVYQALDVLLMASDAEGGPLVVPEAWAAGIPIVATPVGIIPELEEKHGPLTYRIRIGATGAEMAAACNVAVSLGRTGTWWQDKARQVAFLELNAARFGRNWEMFLIDLWNMKA